MANVHEGDMSCHYRGIKDPPEAAALLLTRNNCRFRRACDMDEIFGYWIIGEKLEGLRIPLHSMPLGDELVILSLSRLF